MTLLRLCAAAAILAAAPTPPPAADHAFLEKSLAEKVRGFRGIMGIYAKNLDTGEALAVGADTRFPTASLIKVAVMAEVYRQMADGKFSRDTAVTLAEADKAGDETEHEAEKAGDKAADAGDAVAAGAQTTTVKGALMVDGEVDASHIDVDTDAATRTVFLKGTVPNAAQRTAAERIAQSKVSQGYSVRNLLRVAKEPKG